MGAMKTVRNLTQRPLKIALAGGGFLHLGPAQTGQIADAAAGRPAVRKLVDAGELEIDDERTGGEGRSAPGTTGIRESTHGHRPKVIKPKGNRGG